MVKIFRKLDHISHLFIASLNTQIRRIPWFSRRREGSLIANVLLMHLLWGVFVYAMAVIGLSWTANTIVESNFQEQAKRWINTADEMGTPLYISRDPYQIDAIADQIKEFSEIGYLRYFDTDGETVIGEYQSQNILNKLNLQSLSESEKINVTQKPGTQVIRLDDEMYADSHVLRAVAPVWIKSLQSDGLLEFDLDSEVKEEIKLIGFVELGLDFSMHRNELQSNILKGSLLIAVVFVVLLFIGRAYLKYTLKPLEDLQQPLSRLAQGDMGVEVSTGPVKEVNAISKALNATINAIRLRDQKLQDQANHDSLTKLFNRHYFTSQVIEELHAIDNAKHSSALLFIDLDEFKAINDTLGHDAGDRLLIQVAEILKKRTRDYDVVSRFGGDEFVILAVNITPKDTKKLSESILELMRGYQYHEEGKVFPVYCSIGITLFDSSTNTVDQLIKQADSACQKAKVSGRNKACFHEEDEQERLQMIEDSGWSDRLHHALESDGFVLYYQPIISTHNDTGECYEVLIRMRDAEGQLVAPKAFMGAAERFGIAKEICDWVVSHAFDQLNAFNQAGRKMSFSINLSGSVFNDGDVVSMIKDKALRQNIDPSALIFEIPESFLLTCSVSALEHIQQLHDTGFKVAIDGFSASLSAGGRLSEIAFDFIKISQDLMENLQDSPVNQVLIKTAVELSKVMDKKVVAGFIQDEATLMMLKELDVDFVQGYFLGKPEEKPTPPLYLVQA